MQMWIVGLFFPFFPSFFSPLGDMGVNGPVILALYFVVAFRRFFLLNFNSIGLS